MVSVQADETDEETEVNISLETIGPEQASEILGKNPNNRPIRNTVVDFYADQMANGLWRLTHQGIAIDEQGRLLDGQHRLAAIVKSGTVQKIMVTRMVPGDCQIAMDDHCKRTYGDALSISKGEKITQVDIAIVRGAIELPKSRKNVSKQELHDTFDSFRKPLEFIKKFIATKQRGVTSSPVMSAIVLAWFYVDDLCRLEEFCNILFGFELPDGSKDKAAVSLREWALRTGAHAGNKRNEIFKKAQRSIVSFMEMKSLEKIHGTAVYYPWPLIDPVRT